MKRFIAIFVTLCLVLGLTSVSAWADEGRVWQTETTLEGTERFGSAVAAVGDEIYIISGYLNGELKNDVDIYNVKTKQWRKGTPTPTSVDAPAVSEIKGKIYLFNGAGASKLVQIYDTKTDSWTNGASMSVDTLGSMAASVNGKIYVISGRGNNRLDIYDADTNTWSSGASIPIMVDRGTATLIGNHIYIIGGLVTAGTSNGSIDTVQVYDIETDKWTTGTAMPTKRAFAMASAVGDSIYVMGGATGEKGSAVMATEIYNTVTKVWTSGPSLTTVRADVASSMVINGKIYLASGHSNTIESLQVSGGNSILSVLLNEGETVQLSTSYNLENNANYTWSSTNEAVATVDSNGKVTAVGIGTADIYAQNTDGTFKEYIPVKVTALADELRLAVHLKTGEKAKLYLTDDATQVTWSSMDSSVVTISTDGQVTGVKKGLAIVQATLDGQTYQIYVRVNG